MVYDIAIIGAGPAGLSAAITARARNKEVLVVSNKPYESPLAKAKVIENYPGFTSVSGRQLLESMFKQAQERGVFFCDGRVISVLPTGTQFTLTTSHELYEARSVILAMGAQTTKPFVGEDEYLGRGVSYCATCDGMLYRNSSVCVVGLNAEAVEEANFLISIGAKVVFLAKTEPSGLHEEIVIKSGSVVEIKGDMMGVSELIYKDKITDKDESILCNGVFILRPSIAPKALIAGLQLEDSAIATNREMCTSVLGVFAAGDCVGKPLQIAKAVGEGQRACFSAVEFLDAKEA